MKTHFLLNTSLFAPTDGELDEEHDDYINPGMMGLELGNFLEKKLSEHNVKCCFRCQEDWGHYLEVDHVGQYKLSIGCANTGDDLNGMLEHRVFVRPDKPVIRRFFRKVDVSDDVENLTKTLAEIFSSEPNIVNVRLLSEDEI